MLQSKQGVKSTREVIALNVAVDLISTTMLEVGRQVLHDGKLILAL